MMTKNTNPTYVCTKNTQIIAHEVAGFIFKNEIPSSYGMEIDCSLGIYQIQHNVEFAPKTVAAIKAHTRNILNRYLVKENLSYEVAYARNVLRTEELRESLYQ